MSPDTPLSQLEPKIGAFAQAVANNEDNSTPPPQPVQSSSSSGGGLGASLLGAGAAIAGGIGALTHWAAPALPAAGTAIGEAFGGVGLGYGLTLGGPVRAIREQAGAVGALRTIESVLARVPGLRGSRFLQDVTSGLTRRATGEGPGGGPPGR